MDTKDHIRIVIPARVAIAGITLVLFILLSFSVLSALDPTVWVVLKDISTDMTGSVSVDNNENGVIDNADSCNGTDVCTMTQLRMTGGGPGPTKALTSDATGLASWQDFAPSIPKDAVAFFDGTTCPDGWTELVEARGRLIVGLPAGGTLGGTVGTPLGNLENRPIGGHTHPVTDPGHNHNFIHPWGARIMTQDGYGMGFNKNAAGKGTLILSFIRYLTNFAPATVDILPAGVGKTQQCGSDVGACRPGTQACGAGNWGTCDGGITTSDEICDGIDNDCNGVVDDIPPRVCGASGVGQCSLGIQYCTSGTWGVCEGEVTGTDEVCDGIDNNCDGLIDNEIYDGIDNNCDGLIDNEICDGVDNDGDELIDEDGCACTTGDTRTCSAPCGSGIQTCEDGFWGTCEGSTTPSDEVCDNIDNDCNDVIDDGLTQPCGSATGQCKQGTQSCAAGVWGACDGDITGTSEVCDGIDNDCDGTIDNGADCTCSPDSNVPFIQKLLCIKT